MMPDPIDNWKIDMENGFVDDDEINRLTGEGGVATELTHRPSSKVVKKEINRELQNR